MELRLYHEFADWFHLLTAPHEYAEEAGYYQQALVDACEVSPRTLLELGSGGGNNASHLKARFQMTLVEPSTGMLAMSRRINPECEHVQGDMRTIRLGREFDAVFVHDAVVYMTSEADLRQAMATAYVHCRRGGAALFAPDAIRETFRSGTHDGGHDGDGRALRFLEWHWDPDPGDNLYTVDYALMLRERDGSLRVEHDRHVEGLFARDQWLQWLRETGFEPAALCVDHSELEPGTYYTFVGRKR